MKKNILFMWKRNYSNLFATTLELGVSVGRYTFEKKYLLESKQKQFLTNWLAPHYIYMCEVWQNNMSNPQDNRNKVQIVLWWIKAVFGYLNKFTSGIRYIHTTETTQVAALESKKQFVSEQVSTNDWNSFPLSG